MNKKIIINTIYVILWCFTVFTLSAEIADNSSNTSGNTIKFMIKLINRNISNDELQVVVNFLQPVVRKTAHFTLFAVGGILIYNMLDLFISHNKPISIKVVGISWLTGTCYAITDEVHQLFVPGRSCELRDMLIDSTGVLVGIVLLMIVIKMCNECNKN